MSASKVPVVNHSPQRAAFESDIGRRAHCDRSRDRNRQGYTLRHGSGCRTFGVHLILPALSPPRMSKFIRMVLEAAVMAVLADERCCRHGRENGHAGT